MSVAGGGSSRYINMDFPSRYKVGNNNKGGGGGKGFRNLLIVVVLLAITGGVAFFIMKRGESDATNDDTTTDDTEPDYTEPDYTEPDYIEPDYTEPDYIEPGDTEPDDTEPAPQQWKYKIKSPCGPETIPSTNTGKMWDAAAADISDGFPRKAWAEVEVTSPEGIKTQHKFQCGVWKSGTTMDGGDQDARVLQCDPRYFDNIPTDAQRAKESRDSIWTDHSHLREGEGEVPYGLRCRQKVVPDTTKTLHLGNNTTGDRFWFNHGLSIPLPDENGHDTTRPGFVDQCVVTFAKHADGNSGRDEEEEKFTLHMDPREYSKMDDGEPVAALGDLGSMNNDLRSVKSYSGCNMKLEPDSGPYKVVFNGCPRGEGATKWIRHDNTNKDKCQKLCDEDDACNVFEINGSTCHTFTGERGGEVHDGDCGSTMKAYYKMDGRRDLGNASKAKSLCIRFHKNDCGDRAECFEYGKTTEAKFNTSDANHGKWTGVDDGYKVSSLQVFSGKCRH